MYTYKARLSAKAELAKAYEDHGVSEGQVRAFLKENSKYASPLHHSPHAYAGSAANLVAEVAPLITQSLGKRLKTQVQARTDKLRETVQAAPGKLQAMATKVVSSEFREAAKQDVLLVRDIAQGKITERFGPLVARLAGKAYPENNPDAVVIHDEPLAAE
mgnify:CR=1 FL=1